MENAVSEIESYLQNTLQSEISSALIGQLVMEKLKALDEVAYIRFASVYRQFKDINDFMAELQKLLLRKKSDIYLTYILYEKASFLSYHHPRRVASHCRRCCLFKFPNHFTTGGVSALSIIFGFVTDAMSPGTFVFIINAALLVVGFIVLGGSFGIKTVYASLLFSVGTMVLEKVVPLDAPLTDQPLLELFFSVMLPAVGSALMFNEGASSGGTDITAMILKKYTDIDIGKSLLICDGIIVASSFFVFGIKTGLFSVLGLVLKAFVVDDA